MAKERSIDEKCCVETAKTIQTTLQVYNFNSLIISPSFKITIQNVSEYFFFYMYIRPNFLYQVLAQQTFTGGTVFGHNFSFTHKSNNEKRKKYLDGKTHFSADAIKIL